MARMVSGWIAVFCQVEVEAMMASMSSSFEYTISRTIDIWSSGSLPMSDTTKTRGFSSAASAGANAASVANPNAMIRFISCLPPNGTICGRTAG